MKTSRRMGRMQRNRNKVPKLALTSLMDVFTILVFFLLVNSANTEVLETPKQITLPASIAENKPRETVVVFISPSQVTVQGEAVANTAEIEASNAPLVAPIAIRLGEIKNQVIGTSTKAIADSQEVTILADRTVPFNVIKRVMSTCTNEGYARISLAVLQKSSETQLTQN
ncbi:MAG: biopolymer transporter ExbD [Myxococcota bacterium]